jgi:hypothetical protein
MSLSKASQMRKTIFFLLFVSFLPSLSNADTTIINDGCVKYLATGKVYEVKVQNVDGKDLWPKYSWADVLTKYAIVFWDNDEAIVIDLGVFGLLMETDTTGTDLQGRKWEVGRRPWC